MPTSKRNSELTSEDINLDSSRRKRRRSSICSGLDVSNIIPSAEVDSVSSYGLRRSCRLSRKSILPHLSQLTSSEKDMSQSANKEVVPSPVEPPTEASTSVPLLPLEQPTDLSTPLLSVLSAKPLPDFPVWQPSPVTQQSAPLIIEKVPDWLNVNKNYVPPALRGLETISEAAALRVGPATRPPPPPRGRRKKLPPPAPEQPVAAPLRILSFNDPAILCEVQADPEAPLSKFHIASARARLRRQKLRLKKLLSVNGGRCPPRVSVQTEHRFAEFLADWEMDAWQSPT